MPMKKKTLDVHCHGTGSLPGQYTHSLGKQTDLEDFEDYINNVC